MVIWEKENQSWNDSKNLCLWVWRTWFGSQVSSRLIVLGISHFRQLFQCYHVHPATWMPEGVLQLGVCLCYECVIIYICIHNQISHAMILENQIVKRSFLSTAILCSFCLFAVFFQKYCNITGFFCLYSVFSQNYCNLTFFLSFLLVTRRCWSIVEDKMDQIWLVLTCLQFLFEGCSLFTHVWWNLPVHTQEPTTDLTSPHKIYRPSLASICNLPPLSLTL